jgi:hypothetical protein
MSKAIIGLVLFCLIGLGLRDLFHGVGLLAGTIALTFVAVGTFNTLTAFKRRS